MGICCSKKSDKEAGIKLQIEQTIIEQQKLREEEEEIQLNLGNRDTSTKRTIFTTFQNTTMNTNQGKQDEVENEVIQEENHQVLDNEKVQEKQGKQKKTKTLKDDINYFKKTEHVLHITAIIVELNKENVAQYYNLTIRVNLKDYLCDAQFKGVLVTQSEYCYFQLKPETFKEANQYSRFLTFFSNDNYFNANKDSINNYNAFDKLLNVERIVQMRAKEKSKQSRKVTYKEDQGGKKQKKKEPKFFEQHNAEMMEIISVVDIEEQSRFLCVLFHLLVQNQYPDLDNYLVCLKDATFLFERPPCFDQPNVHRVALFYDKLDYSLKDLQQLLSKENIELSPLLHKKLTLNLISILYYCYSKYLFRLNFTLSTLFYIQRLKSFKLEAFGRIKTLLPLKHNAEKLLKTIDEKKYGVYKKAFRRDLCAICDLIIYFKQTSRTSLRSIQAKRRKFLKVVTQGKTNENETGGDYLNMAEQLFSKEDDRNIIEFIKLVLFTEQIEVVDTSLRTILEIMEQLQKQIVKLETKNEENQQNEQNEQDHINLDQINLDSSEDDGEQGTHLQSFEIDFINKYANLGKNKDKLSDSDLAYKEILYSSLLYNESYFTVSRSIKLADLSKLQQAQIVIMNSFYQIKQMKDDSWEVKIQQLSTYIEDTIPILNSLSDDGIDHFHITILFQILSLSLRKPIVLLNQFQRCISKQLNLKLQMERKLREQNQAKGLIEQKKHVVIQTMYAQSYLQSNNYFQAIRTIQKIVGFQLKNHHVASLSYCYSLLVSGEISMMSSQPISAMLNLEMGLSIYNQFFPEELEVAVKQEKKKNKIENEVVKENTEEIQKSTFVTVQNLATSNMAKVEFLLGQSYFESHDLDNSLKCLKRASQLMLRQFSIFADEVVILVLQQLQIHVLQDDVGYVIKIAMHYAHEMDLYYREGKQFKRRCISKLQYIIGCIFEFCGSYLSALRFIERSNRTLSNSRKNNFIIQAYYQQKKVKLIHKVRCAFMKIRNKQKVQDQFDLTQFESLSDAMSGSFQNQFFCQKTNYEHSILFTKYSNRLIKIQGLLRIGCKEKAESLIVDVLKNLSQGKKDEVYCYLKDKAIGIAFEKNQLKNQVEEIQRLIEIHERYLQFPLKQLYILKSQMLLLFIFAKLGDKAKLNEKFLRIDDSISQFYTFLNWQVQEPESASLSILKFAKIKKEGRFTLLYQIQLIIDLIQQFYSVRKNIFDAIHDITQLQSLGSNLLQKMLQHKFVKKNTALISKKQQCFLGYSNFKITKYITSIQQSEQQQSEQPKQFDKQETITLNENNAQPQRSKLVFDLRSYDEILHEKNQPRQQHQKQLTQEIIIENQEPQESAIKQSKHKRNTTDLTVASKNKKKNQKSHKFKINPFECTIKNL